MDEHRFAIAERSSEALDGAIQVGQTGRLVQVVEPRTKERLGLVRLAEASGREQTADRPGEVELLLEPFNRGGFGFGRKKPARARTIADG
jgi:hypothetical protein